jgi:hypothetical protein
MMDLMNTLEQNQPFPHQGESNDWIYLAPEMWKSWNNVPKNWKYGVIGLQCGQSMAKA